MIDALRPYSDYRESGLPWLGRVPAHWELRRLKFLLREVDSRSRSGSEQLLRVSQYTGVTQRRRHAESGLADTRAESLVGYKKVSPQDLVVNIMLAWNGSMGVSRFEGIASPAYCVYRFGSSAYPWYFNELLRTPMYKARIKTASNGVVESRLRLYSDDLGRIEGLLPPLDEQAAIVRFLDYANGRLERAIRAKRKVIALLQEQKQAIIHRAVTKGLGGSVPMRQTELPWLGSIPAHWELAALRRHWSVTDCKHLTVPFVEGGVPLASVREVRGFILDLSRAKMTTEVWSRHLVEGGRKPRRGDIIYCRNVSVGSAAQVQTDIDFAMGQDVCLIRSKSQSQRFLNYFLHCPAMSRQLELLLVGSTFKRVNVSEIKSLAVVVPPRSEQDAVSEFLDEALASFESTIRLLLEEIDLLREYRTSLTADVVTGKLDVREVASNLPEEPRDTGETTADEPADMVDEEVVAE